MVVKPSGAATNLTVPFIITIGSIPFRDSYQFFMQRMAVTNPSTPALGASASPPPAPVLRKYLSYRLRSGRNGRHFADIFILVNVTLDISGSPIENQISRVTWQTFQKHLLYEDYFILTKISLKFVSKGPINNTWMGSGDGLVLNRW